MNILLVTAAINIENKNVPFTKIVSKNYRIEQYENALDWLIENTPNLDGIVFCDNTNFLLQNANIIEKADRYKKKLEVMAFQSDYESVVKQGKGYGEGEIIKFALQNSKLLAEADNFYKLTGRLIVKNLNKVISESSKYINYFIVHPAEFSGSALVSTVFYKVNVDFYRKNLIDTYKKVDDLNGVYLEKLFYNVLLDCGTNIRSFPIFPKISGKSGSTGDLYDYSPIKLIREKTFNWFGFYDLKPNFLVRWIFGIYNKLKK